MTVSGLPWWLRSVENRENIPHDYNFAKVTDSGPLYWIIDVAYAYGVIIFMQVRHRSAAN